MKFTYFTLQIDRKIFDNTQAMPAFHLLFAGSVLVCDMNLTHPPPMQILFSCFSVTEGYPHVLINIFFLSNTEII